MVSFIETMNAFGQWVCRGTLRLTLASVGLLVVVACVGLPAAKTWTSSKENDMEQTSSQARTYDGAAHARADRSKLRMKGTPSETDSFSLVMQTACSAYGIDVDYETVYAMSTNGFAPSIHPPESCRALQRQHGRGRCMDLVASRLGLSLRPIAVPQRPSSLDGPGWWETKAGKDWIAQSNRELASRFRDAFESDEVVITDRGWLTDDYCNWGIVLRADEDGTIQGVSMNGRTDNTFDHYGRFWAVRPIEPTRSAHEADFVMLERAVARIRGNREPFVMQDIVFGLPAMDLWIAGMRAPAFQADAPGDSAGNATLCAMDSYWGAKHTASYLRRRMDTFSNDARPHLEAAARQYDRIASLLEPFAVWERGSDDVGYQAIMGDLKAQAVHVENVLQPCKAAMASAADEIEKALAGEGVTVSPSRAGAPAHDIREGLASTMKTTLTREGGTVRIEGVERVGWDKGINTFLGALVALMQSRGEALTYEYLMGVSGAAFKVQYSDCPSSPCATIGFDVSRDALRATGHAYRWITTGAESPEDGSTRDPDVVRRTREATVACIDRGFAVLFAFEEWGILTGYRDGGETLLGIDYHHPGEFALDRWPWDLVILEDKQSPPDQRTLCLSSLRKAVEMARTQKVGMYWSGTAALEAWIRDLESEERYADAEKLGYQTFVNAWIYDSFCEARGHAGPYLRSMRDLFVGESAANLDRAATLYVEIHDNLMAGKRYAPATWELKEGESWTAEMRRVLAKVMRDVLPLERRAVAELESVLAREGVAVSVVAERLPDKRRLRDEATVAASPITARVLLEGVVETFDDVARETEEAYWQPRSAMLVHLVCMRAAGWNDADYETLMTVSGFGPSFAYEHKDKFWVGWVPVPGDTERIARATGFGWEWLHFDTPESYWGALKKTLDSGRPVRAPHLEELIFAGYQETAEASDRKVFTLCVPFVHPGKWWTWDEFTDWYRKESRGFLGRHTERLEPVAPEASAKEVLQTIVACAEHDPRAQEDYAGGVAFGIEGLKTYAVDIADTSKDSGYFQAGWRGCHTVYPQCGGRRCAAVYLKHLAPKLAEPARERALAAAARYADAYAAWQEWETQLGHEGKAPKDAWEDPVRRKAGAAALRRAIAHEEEAVGQVKAALAALD